MSKLGTITNVVTELDTLATMRTGQTNGEAQSSRFELLPTPVEEKGNTQGLSCRSSDNSLGGSLSAA